MLAFTTHRLIDGLLADRRHIELDGPLLPGTFIVWRPETDGIRPRTGVIIGLWDGTVYVMWNRWQQDPDELGLRAKLGKVPRRIRVKTVKPTV